MTDLPPRRSPLLIVLIALAWLTALAAAIVASGVDVSTMDAAAFVRYAAGLVIRLAPPLVIALAAVVVLRLAGRRDTSALAELEARTAAAAAAGAAVRDGLLDIDATLAAIGGRIETLRSAISGDGGRLLDAARTIETAAGSLAAAGSETTAAAHNLAGIVPRARADADALTATLTATGDAAGRQLGEVETMLAGIAIRHDEIQLGVAAIAAAATAATSTIGTLIGDLNVAVDTALGRTAAAVDKTGSALDTQAAAMLASITAANSGLAKIGDASAVSVAERIDYIVEATAALGDRLAAHDAATATMVSGIERSFTVLDKRMGHAAAMGAATLDGFQSRLAAVRDLTDSLNPRLDAAHVALAAAEAAAARLLPAAATASELARALGTATRPAADIAERITAARADLAALEETLHGSTLTAATGLIDALGRVREVSDVAANRLRETLTAVVADAEIALADAGRRTAASAFADPIRHEIAGLEGATALAGDAAQATANRIAARLLGLTATVATVERRLAEAGREA